ncbi:hypothetical protein B9Z50_15985 [Limnohabitans sp. Bal53]|nr:hypothetical protein B9Z50_15985 [Limnohabitans sp. Bal53]
MPRCARNDGGRVVKYQDVIKLLDVIARHEANHSGPARHGLPRCARNDGECGVKDQGCVVKYEGVIKHLDVIARYEAIHIAAAAF